MRTYAPSDLVASAHESNEAATQSIKAMQEAEVYKEMSKHVFAKIQTEIKKSSEVKMSEAECERLAYASDDWKEFLDEWTAVINASIAAKVNKDNKRLLVDVIQSALSFMREEMRHLGGEP